MSEKPTTYFQHCSMKPVEIDRVSQMIANHPEFSGIRITVNSDRDTYSPAQDRRIPKESVLVTFEIPREGISMVNFYHEFSNALNPETTMSSRERMR